MTEIICHRGFTKDNTIAGILRAARSGLGSEFDVRDVDGRLAIQHDPFDREVKVDFYDLIQHLTFNELMVPLAINIKSAGLGPKIQDCCNVFPEPFEKAFFFDLSGPDTVEYLKLGLNVFSRVSDLEMPMLCKGIKGLVWDCFDPEDPYNESVTELVASAKQEGLTIVQIGPDLWGRAGGSHPLADYVITSQYGDFKEKW